MLGAIIGAATSIIGGIKSAKAARKRKRAIVAERAANRAWYQRRYNEVGTQRADAQRILTKTQEAIRKRNREAAATQAVVGGSEESVAATREANAQALADTVSQINAANEQRKDAIEESYRNQDNAYSAQLNGIEAQRSQNIANATTQAISAAGQIASGIDSADVYGKDGQSKAMKQFNEGLLDNRSMKPLNAQAAKTSQSIFDEARGALRNAKL